MTDREKAISQLEELRSKIRVYAADSVDNPAYKDALAERIDQA